MGVVDGDREGVCGHSCGAGDRDACLSGPKARTITTRLRSFTNLRIDELTDLRIDGLISRILPRVLIVAALAVGAFSAACGPSEPLRVATLQLGKSLNPDNSVGAHTTRFKPDDTVYVSLLSDDPGYGTVTVRWLLNGQVVSEAKARRVIHARGGDRISPAELRRLPARKLPRGDSHQRPAGRQSRIPRRALIKAQVTRHKSQGTSHKAQYQHVTTSRAPSYFLLPTGPMTCRWSAN